MKLRQPAIWIASIILLTILLTLLYLGAPHLLSVPRHYLFRMAIQNTAVIVISVTAAVSLLASLSGRLIRGSSRGLQIVQLVPLTVLSIALLSPPVDTALRHHLQTYPFFYTRGGGLTIIATTYTLILLPIAIFIWSNSFHARHSFRAPAWNDIVSAPRHALRHPLLRTLTLTTLFTLLNPITPLLLTGGEPVNRTYLSPAWIFHTAWVSRNYAQAAAMILWMVPLLFVVGLTVWRSMQRREQAD